MKIDQELHNATLKKVAQVFSPQELRQMTPQQEGIFDNLIGGGMRLRGLDLTVEEIEGYREMLYDHLTIPVD